MTIVGFLSDPVASFKPVLVSAPSVLGATTGRPFATGQREPVDLEIVVPAFNEAKRLPETLRQTIAYLDRQPWRSRVVVVDNGSSDDTAAVINKFGPTSVELATIGCSRPGKGAAVQRGLLTSSSPYVGFIDADLSTPLETLTTVMHELGHGADAVIASRHAPGAHIVRRQSLRRRLGGTTFRMLARPLLPTIHDSQCGFKFFQRSAVQRALQSCRLSGFAFDVELLRQIQLAGGQIVEVPVAWTDDTRSTFHPLRDGLPSFAAVLQLYGSGRA